MTSLLQARGLALGSRLGPLDLGCSAGELAALVGPNGAGKTSLLRALAGVEDARGEVRIDGEQLDGIAPARRRRLLSFLPASREVAWPISVPDVIALGLDRPDPVRVSALLDELALQPFAKRSIGSLSTGERARVLLARALAPEPRLLLLDEPLSNMDPYWVLRTLAILRKHADAGNAVLVALHDLGLVGRFDRLLLLGGGAIAGDGPPAFVRDGLGALFGVVPSADGWRIA